MIEKATAFVKKYWIPIVIIAVFLIIFLMMSSAHKKRMQENEKKRQAILASMNLNPSSKFPLSIGSSGEEVKIIQSYLNTLGASLIVDGVWGSKTDAAVLQYLKVKTISEVMYNQIVQKK